MKELDLGNGHVKQEYEFELSTERTVCIDATNARDGFEPLARALLAEVFFPALRKSGRSGNFKPAFRAVTNEINSLVMDLDMATVRDLLEFAIWASVCREYGRVERASRRRENAERAKKKRSKKKK